MIVRQMTLPIRMVLMLDLNTIGITSLKLLRFRYLTNVVRTVTECAVLLRLGRPVFGLPMILLQVKPENSLMNLGLARVSASLLP